MIPVFKPSYNNDEIKAVSTVLKSGWVGLGPKTEEFEKRFAKYLNVKFAVGLNSCSAALQLAFKVLDLPENSEVITTSMTFISTNHAILQNNLKPVFCDIEPDTLNIDAEKVEALITPKTKAILCVHYGGHACDMALLRKIAKKHKLFLIEDCAHATGGEYKGKKLGTFGDLACFSFHAVKNLATGQGGMIVTNNSSFNQRLRRLRWMGISKDTWKRSEIGSHYSWYYTVQEVGYLYYMCDIIAALGLVQLKKVDLLNRKRQKIGQIYRKAFKDIKGLEPLTIKDYAGTSQHNFVIKLENRDKFIEHLSKKGIATSVHYFPNHLYEIYKPYYKQLPVTEDVWRKIVTLPLYPDLKDKEIKHIISTIKDWFKNKAIRQ